ncbi:hypothetical protein ILUMI_15621 [Ignelater luminosus]|uniref:Uncharacterized protein n=1 Tax=Ignelater luminosus TaxID=2038154 RepID=A0A8K0CSJ5_IGNLU|nr:hypothetical protein ILUMI_15621 [Ignelater luminosus]
MANVLRINIKRYCCTSLPVCRSNNLISESWRENKCAEATSLSRATSFNRTLFFKNLKEVIEKHNLTALQIYNCDEAGVTNVHKPPKILAHKHQKQVGKVTSTEEVKNFKAHMLIGAPTGSSGAAYPIGYYNKVADEWMLNHPGTPMSIYDIASVTGQAFPLAFTPTTITKSFKKSVIYPYNSEVFQDSDFLSSYVSNRIEVANIEIVTFAQNKGTSVIFDINTPSTSRSGCSKEMVSPELVRPHFRASPRKISKTNKAMLNDFLRLEPSHFEGYNNDIWLQQWGDFAHSQSPSGSRQRSISWKTVLEKEKHQLAAQKPRFDPY